MKHRSLIALLACVVFLSNTLYAGKAMGDVDDGGKNYAAYNAFKDFMSRRHFHLNKDGKFYPDSRTIFMSIAKKHFPGGLGTIEISKKVTKQDIEKFLNSNLVKKWVNSKKKIIDLTKLKK